MPKPIFYFKKMDWWDIGSCLGYLILTLTIYKVSIDIHDAALKKSIILFYSMGTHFFIYFFNYKSLRNLWVYFIWIGYGLIHIGLYFLFKDDVMLVMKKEGHASRLFLGTLPLLVLFQFLRFLSAKTQALELVAPSKSVMDIWEERKVTFMDIVFFIVYLFSLISLDFWLR